MSPGHTGRTNTYNRPPRTSGDEPAGPFFPGTHVSSAPHERG